jgi:hypothetical protein
MTDNPLTAPPELVSTGAIQSPIKGYFPTIIGNVTAVSPPVVPKGTPRVGGIRLDIEWFKELLGSYGLHVLYVGATPDTLYVTTMRKVLPDVPAPPCTIAAKDLSSLPETAYVVNVTFDLAWFRVILQVNGWADAHPVSFGHFVQREAVHVYLLTGDDTYGVAWDTSNASTVPELPLRYPTA